MKSTANRALHLNSDEVWADDSAAKSARKTAMSGHNLFVAAVVAGAVVISALVLFVSISSRQVFRSLAAQIGDNPQHVASQLVAQADRWALCGALAGVGGAFLFSCLALRVSQSLRRRWLKEFGDQKQQADARVQQWMAKLADSRVTEEEARKEKSELLVRVASLQKSGAELEKELEQRRQAEKNLAQQTQKLERSKDVLEMHVQARTDELLKLQRRNESILNSAGDGICGFDLQGRATFVNPSAAKLTGWKLEELIGRTEEAIFFPAAARGDSPALLKDENGNYLPEQTFYHKDGSSFPVEYVRTPITENDRVVGTVIMFKDITERRMAEDKLNGKAEELARSNRELEQFAFVASHDLQEPLRKIQAFGDRLKAKCESVQLEEGRDYLERMQNAAARMQNLINDLLTFSRVLSSQQPFVPVDLGAVTKEVLVDLECRIEKTQAQVQVGKLPTVQADATQMRQLLQNLIGNALKFQPPGGIPNIKIDAQFVARGQIKEEAKLPVLPTSSPEDPFCLLTVQDNGIGFEEQYLEKLFAVFQRLHGRSEYEGTGVGLAVCRRITERHGGYITAQSKPGEGSTFIVILPLKQPKGTEPQ